MGQSTLVIGNREMSADQEETGITEVSLLGVFFQDQHTEAVLQRRPRLHLRLTARGVTGLKARWGHRE